ncbi:MAG: peptidylprolyl isomerase [bacterium]
MPNPTATIATNNGTIRVELFADSTPQTVLNFVTLARQGYYDGTKFHRVIAGFMLQGGDPLTKDDKSKARWGTGGPGYNIEDELDKSLRHSGAGILSMANTGRPRTGGSQFFVTLAPTPHLDGKHAVFGRVVEGLDVVKAIGKVKTDRDDRPVTPVVIERVRIEGELPQLELKKYKA